MIKAIIIIPLLLFFISGFAQIKKPNSTQKPPRTTQKKQGPIQKKKEYSSIGKKKKQNQETVTYSNVRMNEEINFFSIGVAPLHAQMSGNALYFGFNSQANVLYKNFYLNIAYNYYYANTKIDDDYYGGESIYKSTPSNDIDIIGGYCFRHLVNGEVPVYFNCSSSARATHCYVTKIRAKYTRYFTLEGGIVKGVKNIYAIGTFKGVDAFNNKEYYIDNFSTNMSYTWLLVGGSMGKLVDVLVDIAGFGERFDDCDDITIRRLYGHLIIPVGFLLDDIYYTDHFGKVYYQYQLNNSIPRNHIGCRIGFEASPIETMNGSFEVMYMPGIQTARLGNDLFLKFSLRFGFGKIFNKKISVR